MDGLFQDGRMGGLQQAFRGGIIVVADLDAPSNVWRAQEQKILQPLVVISAGFNLLVPQQSFEDVSVFDILKNGHLHPRAMSSRGHTLLLVPLSRGVKGKSG